jgi:hypothetical protein
VIWLTWRQFRVPAVVAAGAIAVVLALLLVTGPRLTHEFATNGLVDCAAGHETSVGTLTCGDLTRQFTGRYPALKLVGPVVVLLPALIGAFLGAPLVARELEGGTHRLAWVQSVTRGRWLGARMALIGAASVAVTAALSLAFTWWARPFDRLGTRIDPATFGQRGILPVAYAASAFALGVATALVGFLALRELVGSALRPHLLPRDVASFPTYTFAADEPPGRVAATHGWVLSHRTLDGAGHVLSSGGPIRDDVAGRLCDLDLATVTKDQLDACGQQHGLHDVVGFIPADRFWTLQAAEAAVFVAAGAVAVAFVFWWVRRLPA